jgi:hypothetical protein
MTMGSKWWTASHYLKCTCMFKKSLKMTGENSNIFYKQREPELLEFLSGYGVVRYAR